MVVDVEQYNKVCHSHRLDPVGDWNYAVVSRKLYMVLHTYGANDVRKVLAERVDKCGFEAYRLLTWEFDPTATDISYTLLGGILVIARWQVKTIDVEVSALREALKRVRELERRCPREPTQRPMIAGMLYANVLSPATRKHVMSKSALKHVLGNAGSERVMTPARADLELIKEAIQWLKAENGRLLCVRSRAVLS